MANHTLTQTSVTYATSGTKYGTGCQSGGLSVTPSGVVGVTGTVFTMECWFKKTGVPLATQVIVGSTSVGYIGLSILGFIIFNSLSNNATVTGSAILTAGLWVHAAMVCTASGFVGYVNGSAVGSSAQVTSFGTPNPQLGIGAFQDGSFAFTGGFIDEVAFWSTAAYASNFTPRVSAYSGSEGMVALYHLDSSASDGSTAVSIAPNNAAIVYSPYNWSVTANAASSINAGAYFRTLFTGLQCTLGFNTTNNQAPLSQLYCRIDGYEPTAPWTRTPVANTVTLSVPADTTSEAYHLLECVIKSTSELINRWNAPSNTAVVLSTIMIDSGCVVAAPKTYPKNILFYGDSITEGVRAVNATALNDTDRNDAMLCWAFETGRRLNAEFAMVGFGGSGLTVTGSGNAPLFANSYNLIMAGVARSFTPTPDLIVINYGTQDAAANAATFQSAMQTMINNFLALNTSTAIVVMQCFNATQAAASLAAVQAIGSCRVSYLNTSGFFNLLYGCDAGTTFFPTGANTLARVVPQVTAGLMPVLYPTGLPHLFGP